MPASRDHAKGRARTVGRFLQHERSSSVDEARTFVIAARVHPQVIAPAGLKGSSRDGLERFLASTVE
jgi:hypothetical protein